MRRTSVSEGLIVAVLALLPASRANAADAIVISGRVELEPSGLQPKPCTGARLDLGDVEGKSSGWESTTSLEPDGSYAFKEVQFGGATAFLYVYLPPGGDLTGSSEQIVLPPGRPGVPRTKQDVLVSARSVSAAKVKTDFPPLVGSIVRTSVIRQAGGRVSAEESVAEAIRDISAVRLVAKANDVAFEQKWIDQQVTLAEKGFSDMKFRVTPALFTTGGRMSIEKAVFTKDDAKNSATDDDVRTMIGLYLLQEDTYRNDAKIRKSLYGRLIAMKTRAPDEMPMILVDALPSTPERIDTYLKRDAVDWRPEWKGREKAAAADPSVARYGFYRRAAELLGPGSETDLTKLLDGGALFSLKDAQERGFLQSGRGR